MPKPLPKVSDLPSAQEQAAAITNLSSTEAALGRDFELIEAVERTLLAIRVRTIYAFKPGRCLACDRPHLKVRPCTCPHHTLVEHLHKLGRTIEI